MDDQTRDFQDVFGLVTVGEEIEYAPARATVSTMEGSNDYVWARINLSTVSGEHYTDLPGSSCSTLAR